MPTPHEVRSRASAVNVYIAATVPSNRTDSASIKAAEAEATKATEAVASETIASEDMAEWRAARGGAVRAVGFAFGTFRPHALILLLRHPAYLIASSVTGSGTQRAAVMETLFLKRKTLRVTATFLFEEVDFFIVLLVHSLK